MTGRILGVLLFAVLACLASPSHAQHGPVTDGNEVQTGKRYHQTRHFFAPRFFNRRLQVNHSGVSPRQYDPYDFYDTSARYPKYYGAFHYRHFSDIGIPAGDIGLRGNGIYWTPW